MNLKYLCLILSVFGIQAFSQEIQLVDVVYKENLSYYHLYEKNSLIGDQYTEIHNISILSDEKPNFSSIYNCNTDYPSFYNINPYKEFIVSFSMSFKGELFDYNTLNKLKSLREKLIKYNFSKKVNLSEENGQYKLLEKTINKGVFLVFLVSRNYFNGNDSQMWLYGKKRNRDITVYRLLTEEDSEWINNLIKQKSIYKSN